MVEARQDPRREIAMYGSRADALRSTQNMRLGAIGLLIVSISTITGMYAQSNPTRGMVYGSYMLTLFGLVVFAVAVSCSNTQTWQRVAAWSVPTLLAAPLVATLFT